MPNYSQIVKDFVDANPKPNINYLPNLILFANGKNKLYGEYSKYYLPEKGTTYIYNGQNDAAEAHSIIRENIYTKFLSVNSSSDYCNYIRIPYIRFIAESNMLEIALCKINGTRPDKNLMIDKREWRWDEEKETPRIFIFTDHQTVYDTNGDEIWEDKAGRYYNHAVHEYLYRFYRDYKSPLCNMGRTHACFHEFECFLKACGISEEIHHIYHVSLYYKTCYPRKPKGPAIDWFKGGLEAVLKPISAYHSVLTGTVTIDLTRPSWYQNQIKHLNWVSEKVNDTTYALRCFGLSSSKLSEYNYAKSTVNKTIQIPDSQLHTEWYRIYITANNHYQVFVSREGTSLTKRNINDLYGSPKTIASYEGLKSCPYIAQELAIVEAYYNNESLFDYESFGSCLMQLKIHPAWVQLYTDGHLNLFEDIVFHDRKKVLYMKSNSIDLYKYTGLTKDKLGYLNEIMPKVNYYISHIDFKGKPSPVDTNHPYYRDYEVNVTTLRYINEIYTQEELDSMPLEQFEIIYRRLAYMANKSYMWPVWYFGIQNWRDFNPSKSEYFKEAFKKVISLVTTNDIAFDAFMVKAAKYFNSRPEEEGEDSEFFKTLTVDDLK